MGFLIKMNYTKSKGDIQRKQYLDSMEEMRKLNEERAYKEKKEKKEKAEQEATQAEALKQEEAKIGAKSGTKIDNTSTSG